MKNRIRVITLLSSIFIISILANAQQFNSGVIAGINATQVDGDAAAGYNRLGLSGGGFVNINFKSNLSSQFELKYMGKGSIKNQRPEQGDYNSFSINLRYIEIPVIFQYHYQEKFIFEGGLYYGYLLDWSIKDYIGDLGGNSFENNDFGGLIGMSYKLKKKLYIVVRASYSAIPIRKHIDGARNFGMRGDFNNVLSLSINYQLNHLND